ncbi:MAG: type II secretion system protein [Patescibacteria group bacterium]
MKICLRNNKGFTLIELLVVIAIISLLSSVVLTATKSARAKARDSGRMQAMLQLRNAIELYNTSNGYYPFRTESVVAYISSWGNAYATNGNDLVPGLIPTYIKVFPSNPPVPTDWAFVYYSNSGRDYFLESYYFLENPLSTNSPFYDSPGPFSAPLFSPFIYSRKDIISSSGEAWY